MLLPPSLLQCIPVWRSRIRLKDRAAVDAGEITSQEGSFRRNRDEFEGKKKRSPTTRTQAVLIADKMMLDREAAFKPAR
jgi:hypothetical protein